MLKRAMVAGGLVCLTASGGWSACCYFAAIGRDVNQPGQKTFISWDAANEQETFTVQPSFEGSATEFGMVIPTPKRPKLQEMPRDFFKALAIFTILEPMDPKKFQCSPAGGRYPMPMSSAPRTRAAAPPPVRVLEQGVVGNLDYKILEADRADALYDWLKQNHYQFSGDKETLDFYIRKKWNFTTMKIDPRQMKKDASGKFAGDITPTRFSFPSNRLIYPLHITQLSVKDSTDALFYVMAREKMDLPGKWSYEKNFLSMWSQAMGYAVPDMLTKTERRWLPVVRKNLSQGGNGPVYGRGGVWNPGGGGPGGTLEWAAPLTQARLDFLTGERKFDRDAPLSEVAKLKVLRGHLKEGWYLTKFRKSFARGEMTTDLELQAARIVGQPDDLDYTMVLPTSPP